MKKFILVATCLALVSCAFKSGDKSGGDGGGGITTVSQLKIDPNGDEDGDGISNKDEIARGSDPFIADVPVLETSFIQKYKVDVIYNKINDNKPLSFSISSKIKDTDSSFNYRVGKLFGVENALNFAAKEGRFSGHSYGEIKPQDFSWVKYPALDPLLLNSDVIKFRPILDSDKFENFKTTITLDSSVKLVGVQFQEIKDLSLNFYYHDYEKDSFVLLKNVLVKRTFQRGINETFSVVIENVPVSFLRESYLKHGEFLISEIDNYFISELGKDYKTLMNGVRAKTVPVMLSTPTEDTIYYAAAGSNGISFLELLNRVFTKNFEVENNILKRIGQYENNLGGYEHLIDLKDKDKVGNWFVLTNTFKEHFLDHRYTPNDHITLSYITGSKLSSQTTNEQSFYNSKVSSIANNETVTPLGKISPNSKIEIAIKGLSRFGHEPLSTIFNDSRSLGGCHNCTSGSYSCQWIGNKISEFDRNFDLTINYNEEWENTYLVINEERFKLSSLIADKKVIVRNLDFSYLVTINDISKIKPIKESEDNNLSLAMLSTLTKAHQGIKLISQGGMQNYPWCTYGSGQGSLSTIVLANGQYGGQVSKESSDLSNVTREIETAHRYPTDTGASEILKLNLMDDIDYDQNFSLAISSKITNYFN